jgi:hypothetical protein
MRQRLLWLAKGSGMVDATQSRAATSRPTIRYESKSWGRKSSTSQSSPPHRQRRSDRLRLEGALPPKPKTGTGRKTSSNAGATNKKAMQERFPALRDKRRH